MKKMMAKTAKRGREEQLVEVLPAPAVTKKAFREPASPQLIQFVSENLGLFNDLFNQSANGTFADYLDANTSSKNFIKEICDALQAIENRILGSVIQTENHDEIQKIIDFHKLQVVLQKPESAEESHFIALLTQGLSTWQLPKIAHLNRTCESGDPAVVKAMTWLEKNRTFLKDCLKQQKRLMRWLEIDQQADKKTILQLFTDALNATLHETVMMDCRRINQYYPDMRNVPVLMDVRKLRYTLGDGGAGEDYEARALRYHSRENLEADRKLFNFLEAYPSPLSCFIDALNGLDADERDDNILKVSGDVLMWLLMAHCDNAELTAVILEHAPQVDQVIAAFRESKMLAGSLGQSMGGVLKSIHNSPVKQRARELPNEVSCIDKSVCDEHGSPQSQSHSIGL